MGADRTGSGRRVAAVLAACALLAGCSSAAAPQDGATAAATVAPSPGASSLFSRGEGTCPPAGETAPAWPGTVPADLPRPPGTQVTDLEERDGLTIVKFTTATSIRQSVLFVVDAMPAAGYTLARGDAENTEADAPFVKGGLRGVLRMIAVEECRTDWLMALTRGAPGGNPLLPARPSASPLPFG